MYPYHSYRDPAKEFLEMLIPALLIFAVALAVVFLVKSAKNNSRKERTESEGSAIAYYIALGFAEVLKFAYFLITGIFKLIFFIIKKIFQLLASLFAGKSGDDGS